MAEKGFGLFLIKLNWKPRLLRKHQRAGPLDRINKKTEHLKIDQKTKYFSTHQSLYNKSKFVLLDEIPVYNTKFGRPIKLYFKIENCKTLNLVTCFLTHALKKLKLESKFISLLNITYRADAKGIQLKDTQIMENLTKGYKISYLSHISTNYLAWAHTWGSIGGVITSKFDYKQITFPVQILWTKYRRDLNTGQI